jgi:hypothetical protein
MQTLHLLSLHNVGALVREEIVVNAEHKPALEETMSPSSCIQVEVGLDQIAGEMWQGPQACALEYQPSAEYAHTK